MDIKIGDVPPQTLPKDTTILQVFGCADVAGRLLIVGKLTAGKTTNQPELLKALCNRCKQQLIHLIL